MASLELQLKDARQLEDKMDACRVDSNAFKVLRRQFEKRYSKKFVALEIAVVSEKKVCPLPKYAKMNPISAFLLISELIYTYLVAPRQILYLLACAAYSAFAYCDSFASKYSSPLNSA